METKQVLVTLVKGVEGRALYINNRRLYGNKPWGGALETIFKATIPLKEIYEAIGCNTIGK